MKINGHYIQALCLLGGVLFLYGFAGKRNAKRGFQKTRITYTNGDKIFIPKKTVNNLLILKLEQGRETIKDSLDLNGIEQELKQNPMIADAEVFETVNKKLGVEVTQREPLARVIGTNPFYIDKTGHKMPLSTSFSARVPLVSGIDSTHIEEVYPLLKQMRADDFLKKHITAVKRDQQGDYILKMRERSLTIKFGNISGLKQKINNFKAFYKKANRDEVLDNYSQVNLKFTNQIVCTKKEV